MATILQIKDDNNSKIRTRNLPSSILRGEDADMRDVVANELRDRGMIIVESIEDLPDVSKYNTSIALVWDVGVFVVSNKGDGEPDQETTFPINEIGIGPIPDKVWRKVISADPHRDKIVYDEDDEYALADGFMFYELWIKPTENDTVKIGTTPDGDEIMLEEELAADTWKIVRASRFADGADLTIYFMGFSGPYTVIIHKKRI